MSLIDVMLTAEKRRSLVCADEEAGGVDERWGSSHAGEVAPAQWRAYGAWARPYIDRPWGMVVHNASTYRHLPHFPRTDARTSTDADIDDPQPRRCPHESSARPRWTR